jgi:hypothetical protein
MPSKRRDIVSRPRKGHPQSYSDFRRLSPAENEREGFTRKARRYVLKSVKRLTKRTPTISARQHETLRTQQEYGLLKPEVATAARQHGVLAYKTGAQREGVDKAAQTRLYKAVNAAKGREIVNQFYGRPGSKARSKRFTLTADAAERFRINRELHLAGKWLDDGDFHQMMQIGENFNDPRLPLLRQSPSVAMNVGK